MMPFKRMNRVIKGFVRNRSRPDGSIAKGFLTNECVSFCQNFLRTEDDDTDDPVVLPKRTQLGRLTGYGHREGFHALHVGAKGRRLDFDKAHRVALQHIELVDLGWRRTKSLSSRSSLTLASRGRREM